MKDILQAIKGWFSAATYITLKHEMIIRLKQKLGEEKGLLQFANQNVLDTSTGQFVHVNLASRLYEYVAKSGKINIRTTARDRLDNITLGWACTVTEWVKKVSC